MLTRNLMLIKIKMKVKVKTSSGKSPQGICQAFYRAHSGVSCCTRRTGENTFFHETESIVLHQIVLPSAHILPRLELSKK